jgi:hypothetical protein
MFDGFDTIGEALALLELHVANPEERDEEEAVEPPVDPPADGWDDPPTGLRNQAEVPSAGGPQLDHHVPQGMAADGEAPESPDLSRLPVGELEDGGLAPDPSSSSDPREEPTATDRLLYAMSELAKYLRGVDVEALAPTLFPNELVQLHEHADEVARFVGRIEHARNQLVRTP